MPNDTDREVRVLANLGVEKRDGASETLVGYAAVFNIEADICGHFRERIARGAFAEAIKRDDIHALYNHDYQHVLGRAKAGTLKLIEDERGLKVEISPPDTQFARDLLVNIRAGNVDQMSFLFTMRGGMQTWDETGDIPLRTIEKVGELWEVSIVPRGAYPDTEIGLRCLEAHRRETAKEGYSIRRARMRMNLALIEREG